MATVSSFKPVNKSSFTPVIYDEVKEWDIEALPWRPAAWIPEDCETATESWTLPDGRQVSVTITIQGHAS